MAATLAAPKAHVPPKGYRPGEVAGRQAGGCRKMDLDIEAWDIRHMGRRVFTAILAIVLASPFEVWAANAHRPQRTFAHTAPAHPARASQRPARPSQLERAEADMAALLRDRNRRRFRHNWEKAIRGLLAAAKGPDRPAALADAARARYALYRWSANEADREEALRLAERAGRLGAADGRALAQAIRREAGDDRPAAPPHRRAGPRAAAVAQAPVPTSTAAAEDEESTDPALERVVNALAEAGEPAAAPDASGPAHVSEVRAWSSPDYTRVVVYLSRWVRWQQLELPATGDRPRRLAIDLSPARLEGRTLERAVGGGRLSRVRAAQYSADTVRVVLDLDGDDRVQVFRLDEPPRLVLDLAAPAAPGAVAAAPAREPSGSPQDEADARGPGPAEAPDTAAAPSPTAAQAEGLDTAVELPPRARALLEKTPPAEPAAPATPGAASAAAGEPAGPGSGEETDRPIKRIVVDAGHGGHDPGAIGPTRVREKDVTLAIARRLAVKLRAAGFEVVLTRSDDRFLALEERTALANAARGDLFVSVHANAHPRRIRTGVETYFLNVTDDRYAARLAARENGVELEAAGDLARILTDLNAKASADASLRLAHLVQREVCGGVRAHVGDVRDLGVKSALFYVLLGARMPAVLVETGFISNRTEERRLATPRYQDEVATGIARAVERFAGPGARVARSE
jgi:N-acetylmuramoyl-L-alanine amidase